ncbi:MAG: hypothetical protein IJ583_01305 [Firmicutes bacterium]|nr:hypothetical protein [Bacillota bacterium]
MKDLTPDFISFFLPFCKPSCSRCPYRLGYIQTFIDICPMCKPEKYYSDSIDEEE